MRKVAVVLFNLGGPDRLDSVKPFLFNLFYDKNILRLPTILRFLIAKILSIRRENTAKEIYSQIGNKSPILENTEIQAKALKNKLKNVEDYEFEVFIVMRYWYPFAKEVVSRIKNWGADKLILLPLYPQYSSTTTYSSFEDFDEAAKNDGLSADRKYICCYPDEENFINSLAELIIPVYEKAKLSSGKNPRILFSAHGLPQKIIDNGDPYQFQVELSTEALVKRLAIKDLDYKITYQSRVGPIEWIKPYTDEELIEAAKEKIPIVLVPIAFVSEHSETLVELDIEYRKLFLENDYDQYYRVQTPSASDSFIESLEKLVVNSLNSDQDVISNKINRICSKEFCNCFNSNF